MSSNSVETIAAPDADAHLLANFVKSGSEHAFQALVIRYSPLVLGVCRRMLLTAEADDAAQAVFVLLWQKARQIKSDVVIAGWLHRTAQQVCRNAIRLRLSRTRHEQLAAKGSANMQLDAADIARWDEIRQILDEEVNHLPEKLRVPFVLFHFEQRSLTEIATMLESTVSTVGTWLQRGRNQLADRLQRRGVTIGSVALTTLLAAALAAEAVPPAFTIATVQTVTSIAAQGLKAAAGCSPNVAALLKAGTTTLSSTTKTVMLMSSIAVVAVGVPAADLWVVPLVQTRRSVDFPRLQGEWREVSSERDGLPFVVDSPFEVVSTLAISDRNFRRFQTLENGRVIEGGQGTFLLNESTAHRAIDFKSWQGTSHAIYEVDGDTLKLCVTQSGGPRPNAFSTSNGDDRMLVTYQRVPVGD